MNISFIGFLIFQRSRSYLFCPVHFAELAHSIRRSFLRCQLNFYGQNFQPAQSMLNSTRDGLREAVKH
jgi:hypothetical protein